jgi:protein ImuA
LTCANQCSYLEQNRNIMIRALALKPVNPKPSTLVVRSLLPCVTFGVDALDARLGGGLARGALHEFYAAAVEDSSAAAAFAVALALRDTLSGRPVVWVRESQCASRAGHLYAAGLVELGFDPDDLVLIDAPDTRAVLRAAADIVKCGEVGAVVVEPWGKAPLLDLTASRRLSMAAAVSGVLTLMLRVDAQPVPSAAQTRWQVAAAPSSLLAANAPGNPAFDIALLRHRGGISGFETRLEWNRDTKCFAPVSGGLSADAVVGAGEILKAA